MPFVILGASRTPETNNWQGNNRLPTLGFAINKLTLEQLVRQLPVTGPTDKYSFPHRS